MYTRLVGGDTTITLCDSNFTQLAYNDDHGGLGNSLGLQLRDSFIRYDVIGGTLYYIGVRSYSSSVSYMCSLNVENSPSNYANQSVVSIAFDSVLKYYAFIPLATETISMCTKLTSGDTIMTLYNSNFVELKLMTTMVV